jgi:imidazoleglycerol-phosphate dehydratase
MTERKARVERTTSETSVILELDLDGGDVAAATGVPFFDHMLDQIGRHGRIGLDVKAKGDLQIDAHHTVEDVGICLGQAILEAIGDKRGLTRYGDALVPMEEALAQVALDISGRPLLVYEAELGTDAIGAYDVSLTEEFFQAVCRSAGITMHVRLLASRNAHHGVEAIFKCVARALAQALAIDPSAPDEIPSTKGSL